MERVDRSIRAAHDQNRILADLQRQVVALGRDFTGHPRNQPFLLENLLHIDFKQSFITVERLRQGIRAFTILQHLGSGLACRFQQVAQAQGCGDVHR
ncbi:hypothetical protein [Pseudomonas viridiflava]|uniref:hypothetical protein n=1 Tax=Pseudomonas viridiflava TaxID=33069 RepID=UPI0039C909AC